MFKGSLLKAEEHFKHCLLKEQFTKYYSSVIITINLGFFQTCNTFFFHWTQKDKFFMKLDIWSSLKVYCNRNDLNQSEAAKSLCPCPFVQTWPHSSRPLSSEWCSLLTMLIAKFISAESCLHLQPVSVFRRLRQKRIPWCKSLRSKSFGMLCWLPITQLC